MRTSTGCMSCNISRVERLRLGEKSTESPASFGRWLQCRDTSGILQNLR